jgi:hypothetical protein
VNGIENKAIAMSAIDKLIRNLRKSLAQRSPLINTIIVITFAASDRAAVAEYKQIRNTCIGH